MSQPPEDDQIRSAFPTWVRMVAIVLIVAMVGFFVIAAL